jgi:hypothetical protein
MSSPRARGKAGRVVPHGSRHCPARRQSCPSVRGSDRTHNPAPERTRHQEAHATRQLRLRPSSACVSLDIKVQRGPVEIAPWARVACASDLQLPTVRCITNFRGYDDARSFGKIKATYRRTRRELFPVLSRIQNVGYGLGENGPDARMVSCQSPDAVGGGADGRRPVLVRGADCGVTAVSLWHSRRS